MIAHAGVVGPSQLHQKPSGCAARYSFHSSISVTPAGSPRSAGATNRPRTAGANTRESYAMTNAPSRPLASKKGSILVDRDPASPPAQGWPNGRGISGRIAVEWVAEWARRCSTSSGNRPGWDIAMSGRWRKQALRQEGTEQRGPEEDVLSQSTVTPANGRADWRKPVSPIRSDPTGLASMCSRDADSRKSPYGWSAPRGTYHTYR